MNPDNRDQVFEDVKERRSVTLPRRSNRKTILVLAANPFDTSRLRLDKEVREITEALRLSNNRCRFRVEQVWAIRLRDLRRALLNYEPHIVHFSGHGSADGLVLEDESGQTWIIRPEALAGLFELFTDIISCVILNACFSELQAHAISRYIPTIIGMRSEIGDEAAIQFSTGFYDGIGAGRSVRDAFKLAKNAIAHYPLAGPVMLKKADALRDDHLITNSQRDRLHYPPGPVLLSVRTGSEIEPVAPLSNLPTRKPLIGRTNEIKKVKEMLSQSAEPVILVQGIGGIGKTALVLEVAYQILEAAQEALESESSPSFQAFIWISDKQSPISLSDFLDSVARVLGYEYIPKLPLDEKQIEVDKLLRTRSCLIVFNGFEKVHDSGVREYLAELPSPSKALITSHTPPWSSTPTLHLSGMKESDALELIRYVGRKAELTSIETARDEDIRVICTATGYTPLAIEWVIGQIKHRGESLYDAIKDLRSGKGDVFEWIFNKSWELQSSESRRILSIMPLFSGSASWTAIEFISEIPAHKMGEALGQLVQMSLVNASDDLEPERKRYSIHPLTGYFASERLAEDPQREVQSKQLMIDYYLNYSRNNQDWEDSNALDALEREHSNLFRAMELSREIGNLQSYIEIHRLTYNMLWARGYWHENLSYAQVAVAAAVWLGDEEAAAWIRLESLGWVYFCQGKFELAKEEYRVAMSAFEKQKNRRGIARAFNYQGRLEAAGGNYDAAKGLLIEGLRYADDDLSIGFLENALGDVSFAQHDYPEALHRYQAVKAIRERKGDDVRLCGVVCRLGDISLVTGMLPDARAYYTESLSISQRIKRLEVMARSQLGLAEVELKNGNIQGSLTLAKEAEESFLRLGAERSVLRAKELIEKIEGQLAAD